MNYSMQGITEKIPELFAMLKSVKVEIKKEHQVLMVNKSTSFIEKGNGKERELQEEWQASSTHVKKPKAGPKPETEWFYSKGNGHWKRNCPWKLAR